jgi:hypothetical protein
VVTVEDFSPIGLFDLNLLQPVVNGGQTLDASSPPSYDRSHLGARIRFAKTPLLPEAASRLPLTNEVPSSPFDRFLSRFSSQIKLGTGV